MIFKNKDDYMFRLSFFMPSSGCNLLHVKLNDVIKCLITLCNFTSNFIFYVSIYMLYPSILKEFM